MDISKATLDKNAATSMKSRHVARGARNQSKIGLLQAVERQDLENPR